MTVASMILFRSDNVEQLFCCVDICSPVTQMLDRKMKGKLKCVVISSSAFQPSPATAPDQSSFNISQK